ncbi:phage nozzle protein [Azospirillum sp. sgz302134]
MTVRPGQFSFAAGELSPLFRNRRDLERVATGARELTNMVALPQGPAVRRPGTRFAAAAKADGILIPFQFSVEQAYVIEATPGAFRFYMDGGRIETGGVPYEVATPYQAEDLTRLRWAQSADVLFLAAPGHPPRTLSRTGHTAWTLAPWVTRDGPYRDVNTTSTTLTLSATTGTVTVTTSAAVFHAGDVGGPLRIQHGTVWGWARITAVTDAQHATAEVQSPFAAVAASTEWRMGEWTAERGYPVAVSFHQNRLCWARGQTVWMSCSADFDRHSPSNAAGVVAADDAVTVTASDDQVNVIRWLSGANGALFAGTSGGPFRIAGSDGPITPASVSMTRLHVSGAGDTAPARIGSGVVFASRTRRRVLQLAYDYSTDGYNAPDLSLMADHIARVGVRGMAWQAEPWSILWAVLDDGRLAGLTLSAESEALAWHRHTIGGTGTRVRSITCIPGADRDELWMLVIRRVGGQDRAQVEVMEAHFDPVDPADRSGLWYVDAGLFYSGSPAAAMTGLDHLEGETVQVVADDVPHPSRVVTGGQVELQAPASRVLVGLGSTARLVSLDIQPPTAQGSSGGQPRRVSAVSVGLLHAAGADVGVEGSPLESIPQRMDGDALGAPPALFTGAKSIRTDAGTRKAALHVVVEQAKPLPLAVTALIPDVAVG